MTNTNDDLYQSSDPVDPRHLRRIKMMQGVFAISFHQDDAQHTAFEEEQEELGKLVEQLPTIDQEIQALAAERPLSEINKVDLAILRSIVFEWKTRRTPKKVLIDEAVELAKEFGTESSPKFVNGVLAHLFK